MRDNDGNGSSVTATQLGRHLDLSRQRIRQLVDEHVIAQLPNGRFDQNDARIRYLRWLRDPERRSAKSEAERDFIRAKTELIDIRIREKRRDVMPTEMAIADMTLDRHCVDADEWHGRTHRRPRSTTAAQGRRDRL
jgi:hypothetical protein